MPISNPCQGDQRNRLTGPDMAGFKFFYEGDRVGGGGGVAVSVDGDHGIVPGALSEVGGHLGHPLAYRACGGLMSDHMIDVVQRDAHCVKHFVEQQWGVGHGRPVDASGVSEHSRGWLMTLGVGET